MDLFEYQAKQLFRTYGVPVSLGEVAETPEQAQAVAEKLGGVTVVKAQVKIGGRGKAGIVKKAQTGAKRIPGIIQSFLRLLRLFASISARFDLLRASVPPW